MPENEKEAKIHRKWLLARMLPFLLAVALMSLVTVNAYKIDPNRVVVTGGGEGSSGSYGTLIAIGQAAAGEASSAGYVTQIGWVYTLINNPPNVGQIQICNGTCELTKTVDPATEFTVRVVVTDPDSQGDVNTESFHIELYTGSDLNGAADSWDHNNMTLLDDNISLGTRNGCVQSGSTYCLNIPALSWTTKFLSGDANIFIRVDDNSHAQDYNSLTTGALIVNAIASRSEDSTSGTYSGNPDTTNNAITTNMTNSYIISTHNGNVNIDVTVRGIDLNVSPTVYIKDNNQSWHLTNDPGASTPFTGAADTVITAFTRGTYPTSNTQNAYYWLDIPDQQAAGVYTSTLTYNSSAS